MEKNVFPSAFYIAEVLPIQISLVVRRLRPIPIPGDQKFMHWGLRVVIPVEVETRVEYQEFVYQLESRKKFIIEPNIDTFRAEEWEKTYNLGKINIPPVKIGHFLFEHPMNGQFYKLVSKNCQRYVLLLLNYIAPQLVKKLTAYSRTVRN